MKATLVKSILLVVGLSISFEIVFTTIMFSMLTDAEQLIDKLGESHKLINGSGQLLESQFEAFASRFNTARENSNNFSGAMQNLRTRTETFNRLADRSYYARQLEQASSISKELATILNSPDCDRFVASGPVALLETPNFVKHVSNLLMKASAVNFEVSSLEKTRLQESCAELEQKQKNTFYILGCGLILNLSFSAIFIGVFNAGMLARIQSINERIESFRRNVPDASQINSGLEKRDEIGAIETLFSATAEKILKSRKRFNTLLNSTNDAICLVDQNERIVFTNQAFERLTGYRREETLGLECSQLVPNYGALEKLFYESKTARLQIPTRTKDDELVDTIWSISPENADGGFIILIHDNTEEAGRRASLERSTLRFQTLLDSLLVGLIVFTDKFQIEFINKPARQLLRIQDSATGQPMSEVLSAELVKAVSERLTEEVSSFEHSLPTQENEQQLCLAVQLSKYCATGETRNILSFLDISARKEIERIKRYFLSMISHDLRTPLASISCSVELVRLGNDKALSEDERAELLNVQESLRLLTAVIDNFLELERLSAGNCTIKKTPIAIKRLLEEAESERREATVQISFDSSESSREPYLETDEAKLKLILDNMISYFQSRTVSKNSIGILSSIENELLKISVSSDKPVSIRDLEQDFAPLFLETNYQYPIDNQLQDLGLSVAARLTEILGGKLDFQLNSSQCSKIWLEFPLTKVSEGSQAHEE